jgi:hypothetical protein
MGMAFLLASEDRQDVLPAAESRRACASEEPSQRLHKPRARRSGSRNRNLEKPIWEPFRLPGAVNETRKKRWILLAIENASALGLSPSYIL